MLNDHEHEMRVVASLQKSVNAALERKYRLGQYAVIWRDGRPQRVEGAELGRLLGHFDTGAVHDRGE